MYCTVNEDAGVMVETSLEGAVLVTDLETGVELAMGTQHPNPEVHGDPWALAKVHRDQALRWSDECLLAAVRFAHRI